MNRIKCDGIARVMRSKVVCVLGALVVSSVAFAAEQVTIDKVANRYPWDGKVDCTYTLSGMNSMYFYRGAFTLSVMTGGERISRTVTNDVASVDGTYDVVFDCVEMFGQGHYPNGGLTVKLIRCQTVPGLPPQDAVGEPIGVKGDVLVIDVSGGATAERYPTEEYFGVDMGLFNCDAYKTSHIVLRKVPAGSYYCQPGADENTYVTQKLTTHGYYIGLFPITQGQYTQVMGTYNARSSGWGESPRHPDFWMSWEDIHRGVAPDDVFTDTSADSFLKRLVVKTGIYDLNLPTEAQWEIAARAGSPAPFGSYWFNNLESEVTPDQIALVAQKGDYRSNVRAAGNKYPNAWGLYDMLGNVYEYCRDVYVEEFNPKYVDTPCTETSFNDGTYRVLRSSEVTDTDVNHYRPSRRSYVTASQGTGCRGFRIVKSGL